MNKQKKKNPTLIPTIIQHKKQRKLLFKKVESNLEGELIQDTELSSKHCLANSMKQAYIKKKDQDEMRVI